MKRCLATASQERFEVGHVVPRVTLALIVLLGELLVDLLLADLDARLQVSDAARRVYDVLVHLLSGIDPLTAALDDDLDGWSGAAAQSHRTTFDDVVDRVWLHDEDRRLWMRLGRLLRTAGRRRQDAGQ